MPTNGMTIDSLNTVSSLTAQDKVPVWDNESSGEPTRKITAQNMANSVKTLASLPNTTEMNAAIAQSTANLRGLTVYDMKKLDGPEETSKPWLVIKRLIGSMPTGNLVGRITDGAIYNYYGYKDDNDFASFVVNSYTKMYGPYKIILNNGAWSYASINVGDYTDFLTQLLNNKHKKGCEHMSNNIEYEAETYDEENPIDTVWVRDGRGKMIRLEVEDDATDD